MAINVVIVEDDKEIMSYLKGIIEADESLYLAGTFTNAEDFIRKVTSVSADVVLMDINLEGISGIHAVSQIKPRFPNMQFIMCTIYEDADRIFESLCAGASGYILKSNAGVKISEAVKEVFAGGSPMSSQIARKVVSYFSGRTSRKDAAIALSPREMEILNYLDQGFRYKEIAARLTISHETVKTHIRNLYEKLHVGSRTEALNKVFGE